MTAPRGMSDERRIPEGVAATYVTFAPSRLRTLRRAYLPLTPDVRAPSQTARIHPTGLLCAPLAQAVAQMLCFGGFRIAADDPPKPRRLRTEALQRSGA